MNLKQEKDITRGAFLKGRGMRGTDPHKQVTEEDVPGAQSHADSRAGKRLPTQVS